MGFRTITLLLRCKHILTKASNSLEPSDSLEPPLGLMGMPDEILVEICANLCSHCSDIPETLTKDLSNLSMTSKHLRAIALPVLHHDASPRRLRSFLRTITEQPDLAAQVRRFCNRGGNRWNIEIEIPNFSYPLDGLTHKMMNDITSCHFQLLKETLAKLTKAEHLIINVPFYEGYLPGKDLLKISFSMEPVTRLSVKLFSGTDLGQMGDFLAMIPCLERLEVTFCKNIMRQLPLASLRSLTFDYSEMEEKSLQNIIDSCPELEYFNFGFRTKDRDLGLENAVTWSQAQRILHSRREILKHLKLEFGQTPLYKRRIVGQEEYFRSFREFNALDSLWVLTIGFGSKDDRGIIPTFPESVQHLVSMLPESLTCICFCGSHKGWNGIQVLAQAIQEGHFPRLNRVMLEQGYNRNPESINSEEHQELFATLGVCFELLHCWGVDVNSRWEQYTTTQ